MLQIGSRTPGQFYIGKTPLSATPISALYIGTTNGLKLLWEAISNCIAGGWWQHGHGWQYGIGWSQKHNS